MKKLLFIAFLAISCLAKSQDFEQITNLNFKLGILGYEVQYYAFDEGDIVSIDFSEQKGKGIKSFEFKSYNSEIIFSKFKPIRFTEEIEIKKKGFYQINIENQMGARICDLKVQRKNVSMSGLSTKVKWLEVQDTLWSSKNERYLDTTIYTPVQVQDKQSFYINSATNLGGQTRVTFPVNLPENTIEWFYTYGCSRKKSEIETVEKRMNLLGELSEILSTSLTGGIASLTASLISKPPGGNQCDVYVLDATNASYFRAKSQFTYFTEGTRENFKSGVVLMKNLNYSGLSIGIRNSDMMHGVHVAIEVVAITKKKVYKTREVRSFTITRKKVPQFSN